MRIFIALDIPQEIRARMPERHLLDILKYAEHWSRYTRHFGPPSGSDPKLVQAVQRYVFTVFGYGCNLGPGQTARHAPDIATAQVLRRINAQHINAAKLEAAMVDVIDQYARFHLPRHWRQRPCRDRRRHPRQAAREQPARLAAHPLRRLRRDRVSPHRRQLHRAVHQLHPVRRLGSGAHPRRAAQEPLRGPARYAARRYPGPERTRLSASAACLESS